MKRERHCGLSAFETREILLVGVGLACEDALTCGRHSTSDAVAAGGGKYGLSDSKRGQIVTDKQFQLFGFRMEQADFPTVPLEQRFDRGADPAVKNFESAGDGVAFVPRFIELQNASGEFMHFAESREGNSFWPQIPLGEWCRLILVWPGLRDHLKMFKQKLPNDIWKAFSLGDAEGRFAWVA